jgi:hypothetical protein
MKKRLQILLLTHLLVSIPMLSQVSVSGFVYESGSGEPIIGASIRLEDGQIVICTSEGKKYNVLGMQLND